MGHLGWNHYCRGFRFGVFAIREDSSHEQVGARLVTYLLYAGDIPVIPGCLHVLEVCIWVAFPCFYIVAKLSELMATFRFGVSVLRPSIVGKLIDMLQEVPCFQVGWHLVETTGGGIR